MCCSFSQVQTLTPNLYAFLRIKYALQQIHSKSNKWSCISIRCGLVVVLWPNTDQIRSDHRLFCASNIIYFLTIQGHGAKFKITAVKNGRAPVCAHLGHSFVNIFSLCPERVIRDAESDSLIILTQRLSAAAACFWLAASDVTIWRLTVTETIQGHIITLVGNSSVSHQHRHHSIAYIILYSSLVTNSDSTGKETNVDCIHIITINKIHTKIINENKHSLQTLTYWLSLLASAKNFLKRFWIWTDGRSTWKQIYIGL